MNECDLERLAIIEFDGKVTPAKAHEIFKRQQAEESSKNFAQDSVSRLRLAHADMKMRRSNRRDGKTLAAGEKWI